MAARSRRKIIVTYSNDVEGEQEISAAENVTSPAAITVTDIAAGATTLFTAPAGATGATIVKSGSLEGDELKLKGVPGDTGVVLHYSDPDSISLSLADGVFYLTNPGATTVTVRIFWS